MQVPALGAALLAAGVEAFTAPTSTGSPGAHVATAAGPEPPATLSTAPLAHLGTLVGESHLGGWQHPMGSASLEMLGVLPGSSGSRTGVARGLLKSQQHGNKQTP